LNTQAEIRRSRRRIVVLDIGQTGWEMVQRRSPSQRAGVWVGEVNVGGGRKVRKGRIQGSIIYIVALNTLKEHSEAAPQHSLPISRDVIGKTYPGLKSVVDVLDVSTGETTHACFSHAIEIELLAAGGARSEEHTSELQSLRH